MRKRDIVKTASEEWKGKWSQAIISYAHSLKSKGVKSALRIVETKFTGTNIINKHLHLYMYIYYYCCSVLR